MSFGIGNIGRSFNPTSIQENNSEKRKAHQQEDSEFALGQRNFEHKAMNINIDEAKAKQAEALMELGVPEDIIQEGPQAVKSYIDAEGLDKLDGGFGSIFGLKIGQKPPKGAQGQEGPPPPPQGKEGAPPPPPKGVGNGEQANAVSTTEKDYSFNFLSGTEEFTITQTEILEDLDIPEDVIAEGEFAVQQYVDFKGIELPKEEFSFETT